MHVKKMPDFVLQAEPEACETCRQGVGMLWKYAQEPANLDREQQQLIEEVCPQMPESAGCSVGVLTWWPAISKVIFSPVSAGRVCNALEPACDLPMFKYACVNIMNPNYVHTS